MSWRRSGWNGVHVVSDKPTLLILRHHITTLNLPHITSIESYSQSASMASVFGYPGTQHWWDDPWNNSNESHIDMKSLTYFSHSELSQQWQAWSKDSHCLPRSMRSCCCPWMPMSSPMLKVARWCPKVVVAQETLMQGCSNPLHSRWFMAILAPN